MPLLVVVLLTKFEGRQIFGVPNEIVGAAFSIAAHRLARRLPGPAPQADHAARPDDRSTRGQITTLAAFVSRSVGSRAGLDGRRDPPCSPSPRCAASARGIAIPASPLGKVKMVARVVAILALILAHGQMRRFYLDRVGRYAVGGGRRRCCRGTTAPPFGLRGPRVGDRVARDERASDRKAG